MQIPLTNGIVQSNLENAFNERPNCKPSLIVAIKISSI